MIQKEVLRGELYGIELCLNLPKLIMDEYDRMVTDVSAAMQAEENPDD